MTIYSSDGCTYDGMTPDAVKKLLSERGAIMVLEDDFLKACANKKPYVHPTDPVIEKLKAIAKDPAAQPQDRLNAVAQLLGL